MAQTKGSTWEKIKESLEGKIRFYTRFLPRLEDMCKEGEITLKDMVLYSPSYSELDENLTKSKKALAEGKDALAFYERCLAFLINEHGPKKASRKEPEDAEDSQEPPAKRARSD
jgi:hypothetical protein